MAQIIPARYHHSATSLAATSIFSFSPAAKPVERLQSGVKHIVLWEGGGGGGGRTPIYKVYGFISALATAVKGRFYEQFCLG